MALLAGLLWPAVSPVRAQETPDAEPAPPPARPQSLLPSQIEVPEAPEPDTSPERPGSAAPDTGSLAPAVPAATGSVTGPGPADAPLPAPGVLRGAEPLGVLDASTGGYETGLWNGSSGAFVTEILTRMPAPVGLRFGQIALRRALATRASPPAGANPVAFDVARTQLLVRLGAADLASRLAGQVPQASYTRAMYAVAAQAHLAAFNVPATCPLASRAIVFSPDSLWPLLSAICAALQGDDGGAALGLELARTSVKVNRFDLAIADRMVTAVTGGARGGMVDWPANGRLTTFRLAAIYLGGQTLPIDAVARSNMAVQGWLTQSATVDPQARWVSAWAAAATGAINTDQWIGLWAARGASMSPATLAYAPEGFLMRANSGNVAGRLAAIEALWQRGKTDRARMAMYLLTSDAAARLPITPGFYPRGADLARAMMLGGKFAQAERWYGAMARDSSAPAQAAALEMWLPLKVMNPRLPGTADQLRDWISAQSGDGAKRRGRLALAALRGLGTAFAQDASVGVRVDQTPRGQVFKLLAAAASRRARGEVIVLSALLLGDAPDAVSAEALEQIVRALRRVGLDYEARLMATEAILMARP